MKKLITILATTMFAVLGCATAPKTVGDRQRLETRAQATLQEMLAHDPGLHDLLADSAGYVVFPEIGKGGVGVGAAWGRGMLFERGQPVGFVELSQASVGAQLGGQTIAELVVFRDRYSIEQLKAGQYQLGTNASAVALTTGAAASAPFADGVAVFTLPRGGLMVEISVSGQKLSYDAG